jgi:hypothetical protein
MSYTSFTDCGEGGGRALDKLIDMQAFLNDVLDDEDKDGEAEAAGITPVTTNPTTNPKVASENNEYLVGARMSSYGAAITRTKKGSL